MGVVPNPHEFWERKQKYVEIRNRPWLSWIITTVINAVDSYMYSVGKHTERSSYLCPQAGMRKSGLFFLIRFFCLILCGEGVCFVAELSPQTFLLWEVYFPTRNGDKDRATVWYKCGAGPSHGWPARQRVLLTDVSTGPRARITQCPEDEPRHRSSL